MARDTERHVRKEGALPAALPTAKTSLIPPLDTEQTQPLHRDQMLALIRALARDAARADHERETNAELRDVKPPL